MRVALHSKPIGDVFAAARAQRIVTGEAAIGSLKHGSGAVLRYARP